ncbi:MAG TPA: hypothetical protein VH855_17140 [Acetobacteraceae bacterium]|jgi:hypothetical protein
MKWLVILVGCTVFALPAIARPPPNADMSLAPWFQGLRQPGTGISCCSIADCRPTDFRTQGDHYEAMIDGQWHQVPTATILERMDNPTGRAVVCYTPTRGIMCFVRGPET